LELLNQWGRNGQGHEGREQPRLHVNVTISQMPEGKSVEETREYVEHEFALVQTC
jgi:hypothetical protein